MLCSRNLYAAAVPVRWNAVPTVFWMKAPGRLRAIAWVACQPVQAGQVEPADDRVQLADTGQALGIAAVQRQFQALRRELERAVSPSLTAELRRILPSRAPAPNIGALRIEYAALLSWSGSLMIEMLRALAAAHERLPKPSAAA